MSGQPKAEVLQHLVVEQYSVEGSRTLCRAVVTSCLSCKDAQLHYITEGPMCHLSVSERKRLCEVLKLRPSPRVLTLTE